MEYHRRKYPDECGSGTDGLSVEEAVCEAGSGPTRRKKCWFQPEAEIICQRSDRGLGHYCCFWLLLIGRSHQLFKVLAEHPLHDRLPYASGLTRPVRRRRSRYLQR